MRAATVQTLFSQVRSGPLNAIRDMSAVLISIFSFLFQGERLSHAVGCAFAICLEKKQQRDKLNVTMTFNKEDSTFTRYGSFRQATITERLQDPQVKAKNSIERRLLIARCRD